eukprot:CAMPEP_0177552826 /NCGR_PEP_ID=MMETSP0369-20130122/67067_1 /TAXON_ID=447022 ORGANISM="Scrippsiella hangoei-like, Strain SHHI-4" /NCGR_SAMPLE_ID=MMETSP0369 /ASSEMBLY_ACC=CAM_ASM_000364 /LENGTH=59 /DNA_ID=CAMNT_0019038629 /DNA_START=418 /DNA_END=594 /DNA_ORIENTATION=+
MAAVVDFVDKQNPSRRHKRDNMATDCGKQSCQDYLVEGLEEREIQLWCAIRSKLGNPQP